MTTTDINQIVLDAFRVEHREQLEQIRTLLDSLEPGDCVEQDVRLTDAFRLAHSFKGGARVCDLHEAERLGHGLESVLEKLSRGSLPMSIGISATITLVLDTIEDWMAALDSEQPLPDTSTALAAVDRILSGQTDATAAALEPQQDDPLLPVFRQEYADHAAQLRELLAAWSTPGGGPDEKSLGDAARIAHTLAGAAGIVGMAAVESAARSLEQLFQAIRNRERALDREAHAEIERSLASAAEAMGQSVVSPPAARPIHEPGEKVAFPAAQESVRVSIDSLEQLTRASGLMLSDLERLTRFTRQLDEFQADVQELERERHALRRLAFSKAGLAQQSSGGDLPTTGSALLARMPELEPFAKHQEHVDRQVGMLARRARQLTVEQRRTTWLLRTRSANLVRGIHAVRMVPAHSVFHGFRKLIRDLAKSEQKEIELVANGMDVRADRMVLQELKDPLMHVLRNCVTHGVESTADRLAKGKPASSRVSLSLEIAEGRLNIVVEDDGRGFDVQQIKRRAVADGALSATAAEQQSTEALLTLLLQPGFSTLESATELAGRGMGLSIVQSSVARLQGQVALEQGGAGGLRVTMSVPATVSMHRVLLVDCAGQIVAIPVRHIERLLRVPANKLETLEGRSVVTYRRCPVRLASLAALLRMGERPGRESKSDMIHVVLLKVDGRLIAASVDALLEERESLIQPLDELSASSQFAGCILLEDRRIALVVQPGGLWDRPQVASLPVAAAPADEQDPGAPPPKILIVDDSFTTRTLEKSILETQGYRVAVAVDGVEALTQLRQQKFAAVISDVEMPRMDGFSLLEQIKSDRRLSGMPVILVTSRDRQEDQRRGLDLGAEAYIVKRKFDHQELLETIRQFVPTRLERLRG